MLLAPKPQRPKVSSPQQIVGIVLVRNEDLYVHQAVANIEAFCDRIILCDHQSEDRTPIILQSMAARIPNAEFHALRHPRESHELLKPLMGTPTWVFGVDGDEVYDPAGLIEMRARVLGGEFEKIWRMKGNALHCTKIDPARRHASGHASPPSRSITKFYNFNAISAWEGDTVERLHGGTITFKSGWHDEMKRNLQDETPWESSPFRCLHLCFLRRSSRDTQDPAVRENIMETHRGGLLNRLKRLVGGKTLSTWKQDHYGRGPLVETSTEPFGL